MSSKKPLPMKSVESVEEAVASLTRATALLRDEVGKAIDREHQARSMSSDQALAELDRLSEACKAFFRREEFAAILQPEAITNLKRLIQVCIF